MLTEKIFARCDFFARSTKTYTTGQEAWLLALLFLLPLLIYWPGLYGDYFLDDYLHIVRNEAIQIDQLTLENLWAAANSTNSGPLGRPLALISFSLNYYTTGLDPFYFKLVNVFIHALTGIGIFFLVRSVYARLVSPEYVTFIAFFTALLWALHPLNVSTVLYSVQRMTGLATFFVVWSMLSYCKGRELVIERQYLSGWTWIIIGAIGGAVSIFAKETAVLIIGYLFIIEWMVYRFEMPSDVQRRIAQGTYGFLIGLPLIWVFQNYLLSPGWFEQAYAHRPFTLSERLLTESRVLWDYLYLTWMPNVREMGLYHDGYPISRSLFDPAATFAAITAQVLLVAVAFAIRKNFPLLLFAVAWFYVGHSSEATFLPLELKYEHRNYLPMLGMLLLLSYLSVIAIERMKNLRKIRSLVLLAVLITFSGSTLVRSMQFGDFWGFAGMEAEHHPESSRANQNAAISLIKLMMETNRQSPQLIARLEEYLQRSVETNTNTTAPLFTAVLFLPEFTQSPPPRKFIDELAFRLRYALPDANINTYFSALLRQAHEGKLKLSNIDVNNLFESAEINPNIPNDKKVDIMAVHASFAQSIERDNRKALTLINKAIAQSPTLSGTYVPAIWIHQEAGLWQDSARLLDRLKKLDIYGIEKESILWLSQRQNNR